MSNQNIKTAYEVVLDFAEKEVSQLSEEIAVLLNKTITKEEIERIEQRIETLEKMFYKT